MKFINHKFIFIGILILLTTFTSKAQEDTISNKFSYHSFSISPAGIFSGNGDTGLSFSGDASFNYKKHIFSLAIGTGSQAEFLGHNDYYQQANFLYGREFALNKRTYVDVSAGAGYFRYNTYGVKNTATGERGEIDKKTIGFPITTKLRFMISRRYSMGLQLQANINSVETIGTLGIILQWNNKRKW